MRNHALVAALVLCLVVITAGIALAVGPHGGYDATTDQCKSCHDVHAAGTSQLLVGTVYATCRSCHSSTGMAKSHPYDYGIGAPRGEHTPEVTTTIPGGSAALPRVLSCDSCHSPHDNNVVTAYTDDDTQGAGTASSHLLKQAGGDLPSGSVMWSDLRGPGTTTYDFYGSGWCADCHDQRHTAGIINNHPASLTSSYAYLTLAGSNTNYHLTPASAGNQAPGGATMRLAISANLICQSCHEDSRQADSVFVWTTHGFVGGDNPSYKDFPHQTEFQNLKVEGGAGIGDDLCLNCHVQTNLP